VRKILASQLLDVVVAWERWRALGSPAGENEPPKIVIIDVPLLPESPLIDWCHRCVFVEVSDEERERRCVENRNWPVGERARREATQTPLSEKRARASWIVDNNGSPEHLRAQVTDLYARLTAQPPGESVT
jgi:dephospho-CoA kinase